MLDSDRKLREAILERDIARQQARTAEHALKRLQAQLADMEALVANL